MYWDGQFYSQFCQKCKATRNWQRDKELIYYSKLFNQTFYPLGYFTHFYHVTIYVLACECVCCGLFGVFFFKMFLYTFRSHIVRRLMQLCGESVRYFVEKFSKVLDIPFMGLHVRFPFLPFPCDQSRVSATVELLPVFM